jgi:hypothetical protein
MSHIQVGSVLPVTLPAPGELSGPWSAVRFRRATQGSGFVLLGIPVRLVERVCDRLFILGCKLLSEPFFSESGHYVALQFSAPAEVAARLALVFPAPAGAEPLVVAASGSRLLSGVAVKPGVGRVQSVVGGPAQGVLL